MKSGKQWELFYHEENTRNRYRPAGLLQSKLPSTWRPAKAIKSSQRTLRAILPETDEGTTMASPSDGIFSNEMIQKIRGVYTIDQEQWALLKMSWHTSKITLFCGSDGGLKDTIGTSGYVIYCMDRENPLITGYAAEKQDDNKSSSTRQELLAQLSIEYWLIHLVETFGQPDVPIEVHLITDSQASIIIRDKMSSVVGMTDLLKPDAEIALEMDYRRAENKHTSILKIHKVQSHIAEEESPDEFFWRINNEADRLATTARERVQHGEMEATSPGFLEGSNVMCIIRGKYCTNNLHERIFNTIHQET